MKKLIVALLALILILIVVSVIFYSHEKGSLNVIDSFESCAEQGYPIMESYPRQCKTPDGRTFVEDVEVSGPILNDLIRVTMPQSGQVISSPFTISGQARGTWYFEASFPATLVDANGTQIAVVPVTAQGEWMTEDFVPFVATMTFPSVTTSTGTLILQKDNPSGLPEHDAHIEIPVTFSAGSISNNTGTTSPIAQGECKPTGCSGQICSDQDIASTCEFKEEYACYQAAECKRQIDGQCGWSQTASLALCIQNARN